MAEAEAEEAAAEAEEAEEAEEEAPPRLPIGAAAPPHRPWRRRSRRSSPHS